MNGWRHELEPGQPRRRIRHVWEDAGSLGSGVFQWLLDKSCWLYLLRTEDEVKAGLEGPSKTIIVEPAEQPLYVPEEAPVEEPVKA